MITSPVAAGDTGGSPSRVGGLGAGSSPPEAARRLRRKAHAEDYTGERTSNSFLPNGTLGIFKKMGLQKARKIALR